VSSYGGRSGDLYDSSMGQLGEGITGGSLEFKKGGRIHHTVFGEAGSGRFSWDTRQDGGFSDTHFTDTGYPKNDPRRHPFGG
jgi:hypothetical protein